MIIEILPVNPHTFEQAQYLMQAHFSFFELETVEDLLRHWKRRLASIREKIIWYSYKSKCLLKQGKREESLKVLKQGLQLLKKISDEKLTFKLNIQLILHKIKQGYFNEASTILKTLEAISKESKQPNQVGLSLLYRGWILESKGSLEQSLKIYLQTLSLFEKSGNPLYIVNSFNKIAKVYSNYNQLDIALEYYNNSLKLLNYNGTLFEKTSIITNIAFTYSESGKLDLALNYYIESLGLNKLLDNPQSNATTSHNVALGLQKRGELDNALTYYKQAFEIATQIDFRIIIASSQMNICLIYYLHGQINKASTCYYQTLEILEDIEDPNLLSILLNNLGLIYSTQENFEQALVYFNRTLMLRELIGNPCLIAEVIFNIACVHAKKRVLTDDLPILTRFPSAPYQSHITQAYKLMLRALLNEMKENWVEAAKTWKEALEVEGLAFGYQIQCHQQLIELSYRKWLTNKSEINYNSLIKKLDVWEEFCKTKTIPQGLCQIYLIRAKINMKEYQYKEAERLLKLCKTTSVEIGLQTYRKLAEKELINLQGQLQNILLASDRARKDCHDKNK